LNSSLTTRIYNLIHSTTGRYTGRTDTFVELKTSLVIRNARDEANFEKYVVPSPSHIHLQSYASHRKLLKFYFQSFLLGVPEIIVGFRTREGVLSTLQYFKTVEIPRLVRAKRTGSEMGWDPGVCLGWGDRFLGFLKGVVCGRTGCSKKPKGEREESGTQVGASNEETDKGKEKVHKKGRGGEPTVWRVTFRPRDGVSVRELDEEEVEDVRGGDDRVGFLPRWFWEEEQQKREDEPQAPPRREEVVVKKGVIPPGWLI